MTAHMPTAAEMRRANLLTLAAEAGGQANIAAKLDVTPSQVSQWIKAAPDSKTGKPRVIGDDSARRLESLYGKPRGWMDHDHQSIGTAATRPPTAPDLGQALGVVLGRLPGLDEYAAGQVLRALQSAMGAEPPLERIEADLLRLLSAPHDGTAARPEAADRKQPRTG